jgi:hypothetical protein
MQTHKAKFSINALQILVSMKFRLLNAHLSSTKLDTWIMAISTNFAYFEMLWDRMEEVDIIFHILVKGLLILRKPKATSALVFSVILNMNFCTSKVDAHNMLTTTSSSTPIFLGTKKRFHNIHCILQATNSDDIHYKCNLNSGKCVCSSMVFNH